jgi:prepilin-type N-terminal cleavage/methylation domain-containing protein
MVSSVNLSLNSYCFFEILPVVCNHKHLKSKQKGAFAQMNRLKTLKDEKGFTIIEVMIVLAIAGLIILIVFLAVPALQRNNRNTSRKSDVGRVGAAVSEFLSNNANKVPSTAADAATIEGQVGTLSQYPAGYLGGVIKTGAQAANTNTGTLVVVTGAKCSGAATVAGTPRQMAILYAVENAAGGGVGVCQEI